MKIFTLCSILFCGCYSITPDQILTKEIVDKQETAFSYWLYAEDFTRIDVYKEDYDKTDIYDKYSGSRWRKVKTVVPIK